MDKALLIEDLGKSFRHRDADGPATFRHWVESGFRSGGHGVFWALRHVSFDVARGEMLGVIGRNGSGKSTLLRLLGGVMHADEGRVTARSPVNGLLELNTGMHPDLTGRENIMINGVLAGLLKTEVAERAEAIIDFAEIRQHIDEPVRTYSSGMRLRLGFSVAVHTDPTILLIDEVLAVGDLGFQKKCLDRIREFQSRGCAIVLISHDMGQIKAMCDRALWLDRGTARALGEPHAVVNAFESMMQDETARRTALIAPEQRVIPGATGPHSSRQGSLEAEITAVSFRDAQGNATTSLNPGEPLVMQATLRARQPIARWQLSVTIANAGAATVLDVNTEKDGIILPDLTGELTLSLQFDRLDLAPGGYTVSVGVWDGAWSHAFDYHQDAYVLEVAGAGQPGGLLLPPRSWRVD
jgi:lipopolysaccharide transport system ATP-binding protein